MRIIPVLLIAMFIFSSCKEIHKRNMQAQNEAAKEIRSEELDKEIKMLEYQASQLPKSESKITQELSEKQQDIMNKDTTIAFCNNEDIGFKFTVIKKVKINMSDKESEINAKYKIYMKAKELKADGIINYKIKFSPFYVSGVIVKKQ